MQAFAAAGQARDAGCSGARTRRPSRETASRSSVRAMHVCAADDMSSLERRCYFHAGERVVEKSHPRSCDLFRPCTGSACLRYEEQLSEALQRSLILLQHAHARTSASTRILRALRLLPFFRDGRRGSVAELVAAGLHQVPEAREAGLDRHKSVATRRPSWWSPCCTGHACRQSCRNHVAWT